LLADVLARIAEHPGIGSTRCCREIGDLPAPLPAGQPDHG
jgi:hypothetical protein